MHLNRPWLYRLTIKSQAKKSSKGNTINPKVTSSLIKKQATSSTTTDTNCTPSSINVSVSSTRATASSTTTKPVSIIKVDEDDLVTVSSTNPTKLAATITIVEKGPITPSSSTFAPDCQIATALAPNENVNPQKRKHKCLLKISYYRMKVIRMLFNAKNKKSITVENPIVGGTDALSFNMSTRQYAESSSCLIEYPNPCSFDVGEALQHEVSVSCGSEDIVNSPMHMCKDLTTSSTPVQSITTSAIGNHGISSESVEAHQNEDPASLKAPTPDSSECSLIKPNLKTPVTAGSSVTEFVTASADLSFRRFAKIDPISSSSGNKTRSQEQHKLKSKFLNEISSSPSGSIAFACSPEFVRYPFVHNLSLHPPAVRLAALQHLLNGSKSPKESSSMPSEAPKYLNTISSTSSWSVKYSDLLELTDYHATDTAISPTPTTSNVSAPQTVFQPNSYSTQPTTTTESSSPKLTKPESKKLRKSEPNELRSTGQRMVNAANLVTQTKSSSNRVASPKLSSHSPAPMKLSNDSPAPLKLSNDSPAPLKLSNDSPAPLKLSTPGPTPQKLSNDSPAPLKLSNDSPAPLKLSNDSPAPLKLSGHIRVPLKLSNHSPAPMKLSNDSPAPLKLSNDSPAPLKLSNDSPAPLKLSGHIRVPLKLSNHSPAPMKLSNDSPAPLKLSNDSPAPLKLSNDSPAPLKLSTPGPTPQKLSNDSPAPLKLSNDSPVPLKLSSHSSAPLKLSKRNPVSLKLSTPGPTPQKLYNQYPAPQKMTKPDAVNKSIAVFRSTVPEHSYSPTTNQMPAAQPSASAKTPSQKNLNPGAISRKQVSFATSGSPQHSSEIQLKSDFMERTTTASGQPIPALPEFVGPQVACKGFTTPSHACNKTYAKEQRNSVPLTAQQVCSITSGSSLKLTEPKWTGDFTHRTTTASGYPIPALPEFTHPPANSESPLKTTGSQSPIKTTGIQSPIKTTGSQSPIKTTGSQSPIKTTGSQSPIKTMKVVSHEVLQQGSNSAKKTGTESSSMPVVEKLVCDNINKPKSTSRKVCESNPKSSDIMASIMSDLDEFACYPINYEKENNCSLHNPGNKETDFDLYLNAVHVMLSENLQAVQPTMRKIGDPATFENWFKEGTTVMPQIDESKFQDLEMELNTYNDMWKSKNKELEKHSYNETLVLNAYHAIFWLLAIRSMLGENGYCATTIEERNKVIKRRINYQMQKKQVISQHLKK